MGGESVVLKSQGEIHFGEEELQSDFAFTQRAFLFRQKPPADLFSSAIDKTAFFQGFVGDGEHHDLGSRLPLLEIMDAIDIELCNGCEPVMVIGGLECLAESVFADWFLPGFAIDELALKRKLSVEAGEVRINEGLPAVIQNRILACAHPLLDSKNKSRKADDADGNCRERRTLLLKDRIGPIESKASLGVDVMVMAAEGEQRFFKHPCLKVRRFNSRRRDRLRIRPLLLRSLHPPAPRRALVVQTPASQNRLPDCKSGNR